MYNSPEEAMPGAEPGIPAIVDDAVRRTVAELLDRGEPLLPIREDLSPKEAAALLGVAEKRLQTWRHTGEGPPFQRWGNNTIKYPLAELRKWKARFPLLTRSSEAA